MQGAGPTETVQKATAEQVLASAAAQATDPPAEPGQYWEFTSRSEWATSYTDENNTPHQCLVESTDTTYAPVDGNGPTWEVDVTDLANAKRLVGSDCTCTYPMVMKHPTGEPGWDNPTAEWVAQLPDTVDGVREELYAEVERYVSEIGDEDPSDLDGMVQGQIMYTLRTGMAPVELRSKLFEVLKTMDALTVVDDNVKVGDRTGVTLGVSREYEEYNDLTHTREITIDAENGEILRLMYMGTVDGEQIEFTKEYEPRTVVDDIPADVKQAKADGCYADGTNC